MIFEQPESNIFIYGLIDPRNHELKYVGQTIQGLRRIYEHKHHSNRRNKRTNMLSRSNLWINELKKNNERFDFFVIEYCDQENLDELEEHYISYFKSIGCNLLNHQPGGKPDKGRWSEETRKKISDRTKEAMSSPEVRAKCKENRRKQGGFNKGKKFSEIARKNISAAQEHKVIYIQDETGKIYRGLKHAAKDMGVTFGTVWKALNGYCKTVKGHTLRRL